MNIDAEDKLFSFIKTLPIYNSVDAKVVLTEFYETLFKLYNHYGGDNSRPLASVAMHPHEDFTSRSLLEESIKSFARKNIKETFGINYLEFMNLPRDVVEMMTTAAYEELKKKVEANKEIQSELDQINQQP
jgi:hypothetical protein